MKRNIAILIVLMFSISACGVLQRPAPTPSESDLATQVSQILTSMPGATSVPPAVETVAPAENTPQVVVTVIPPQYSPTAPEQQPTDTSAPTEAATATITQTPTVTNTPAPTFTPSPNDPRLRLGNPTWQDNFDTDRNWPVGDDTFSAASVTGGNMVLTGKTTLDGWRLTWPKVADFYMEMTVKTGDCTGSDRYGMIVRVPDLKTADSGYLFGFTCDGRYALRKWDGKAMTSLIGWTSSSAIQAGSNQTNRLGLMAVGSRLILYANGTLLKEAQDSAFNDGGFGVFIGANQTTNFTVYIDNMAYWENPQP